MCLSESVSEEVGPGEARAASWLDIPTGDAPFGLPKHFKALEAYCVNRELALPGLQLPLLIHSTDLVKLCPRWLELTGIIRNEVKTPSGPDLEALRIAYNIAAAEYRVAHTTADMPIVSLITPIEDKEGRIVFEYTDPRTRQRHHTPTWTCRMKSSRDCSALKPSRTENQESCYARSGRYPTTRRAREARVMDQVYLEAGSPSRFLNLNSSARRDLEAGGWQAHALRHRQHTWKSVQR